MMKLASTCPNSDMGSFGDFCVCIQTQSNLVIVIIIKSPNEAWGLLVFAPFLIIIIIILIPPLLPLLAVYLSDQIIRD